MEELYTHGIEQIKKGEKCNFPIVCKRRPTLNNTRKEARGKELL